MGCATDKIMHSRNQNQRKKEEFGMKVAKMLGVDIHAVTDRWIKKYGLPARKKYIFDNKKKKYYKGGKHIKKN